MQKIKISDAAKTLGIAPETLRHYEKKHIVAPEKDDSSGYRFFKMNDLCVLSKVRSFMQYGFSIDDAYQIVMAENFDQTKDMLLKRSGEIQEEMNRQMQNLQSLYMRMNLIHRALDNLGRFSVQECEDFELLEEFDGQGNLQGNTELHSSWINQTVTYPFSLLNRDKFLQGNFHTEFMGLSLAVSQKPAGMPDGPEIRRISPGHCLFVCYILDVDTMHEIDRSICDYLNEHRLTLRDDIFERTVSTMIEGGKNRYLAEFWIPIAEKP